MPWPNKKRNADLYDEVIKPKSRRGTTDAVQILKEKFEIEKEMEFTPQEKEEISITLGI